MFHNQPIHRCVPRGLAVMLILAAVLPRFAYAEIVVVTTHMDVNDGDTSNINTLKVIRGADGRISLREAIIAANNTNGPNTITFNVEDDIGESTIITLSASEGPLPPLSGGSLTIDGGTRGDVTLDGQNSVNIGHGLSIVSTGNVIRAMRIQRFALSGIYIAGEEATDNVVTDCLLGAFTEENLGNGVGIDSGASDNLIGGLASGEGNIISSNRSHGVWINSGCFGNQIVGNRIGTNASGTSDYRNDESGIALYGHENIVGPGNLISGNGSSSLDPGILISGSGATNNVVKGNIIGLNATANAAVPNFGDGIYIGFEASDNTIGGLALADRNIISGNTGSGIDVATSSSNQIINNHIGTDAAGSNAIGNLQWGVNFGTTQPTVQSGNILGGSLPEARNLISGNALDGVLIYGNNQNNFVRGNYIGLDAAGTAALPNQGHGVLIENDTQDNIIGGMYRDGNRLTPALAG